MALADWPAAADPAVFGGLVPLVVGTESFAPGIRGGPVHVVLSYVATQLDARVEPVAYPGGHPADDWGWNYRPNKNNPAEISTHGRGVALDYNATRHPNGRRGTFTLEQVAMIRRILREAGGLVLWGGDFPTPDEMHFELDTDASPEQVAAVAARLQGDDVALTADDLAKIRDVVDSSVANRAIGKWGDGSPMYAWQSWYSAAVNRIDVDALAVAIVGKLPAAAAGGVSAAEVEQALRNVFAGLGRA